MDNYDLRKCVVDGANALFHRWTEYSVIAPPSFMVGGHGGGVESRIYAVVELEDGSVKLVDPVTQAFEFSDRMFDEYFGGAEGKDEKYP